MHVSNVKNHGKDLARNEHEEQLLRLELTRLGLLGGEILYLYRVYVYREEKISPIETLILDSATLVRRERVSEYERVVGPLSEAVVARRGNILMLGLVSYLLSPFSYHKFEVIGVRQPDRAQA
ncbi:hypothetical protein Trydic_g31 [Trypoxylus dichotomus]